MSPATVAADDPVDLRRIERVGKWPRARTRAVDAARHNGRIRGEIAITDQHARRRLGHRGASEQPVASTMVS
jgi:hypothetical protein